MYGCCLYVCACACSYLTLGTLEIAHVPLFLRKLRNIELAYHQLGRKRIQCEYADDGKSAALTVETSEGSAAPQVVQHHFQVYRKVRQGLRLCVLSRSVLFLSAPMSACEYVHAFVSVCVCVYVRDVASISI